jgi:hypothetical protein
MKRESHGSKLKWYHFFKKHGGGKVYSQFTDKPHTNIHSEDADPHYYKHSESYVNNNQNELSKI